MLSPKEPGIRLAVGASGSGKTYGMSQDVLKAVRHYPVMVIDSMTEWVGRDAPIKIPADISAGLARSVKQGAELAKQGKRLIVVVPTVDIEVAAEEACGWARDYKGRCGLSISEAHRPMPNGGRLTRNIDDIATKWRHFDVSLWCDTQRLPQLHKLITEQARELRIYTIYGPRDLAVIANEIGGQPLVAAVNECADLLSQGQPGWHVNLGISRRPPFTKVRG